MNESVVVDVDAPLACVLRALQRLDEHTSMPEHRHLLIRAETLLGELLGLTCTGTPDGWYDEACTKPASFDHSGETCPIHEWLVDSDASEHERELMKEREALSATLRSGPAGEGDPPGSGTGAAESGSEEAGATATVRLVFELDADQLERARRRAALLDRFNLGVDDAPESYTPSLALARILASDGNVVMTLMDVYTSGWTAEPVE